MGRSKSDIMSAAAAAESDPSFIHEVFFSSGWFEKRGSGGKSVRSSASVRVFLYIMQVARMAHLGRVRALLHANLLS